jgi:catechol 2,3-dioxygenase-like lactoylglutathione lyase family enzyme
MAFHHLAIATRDLKATHAFYTRAMGFELAKVEVARVGEQGFAKHLFYDTGNGELIAFWDFHDAELPEDWSPAISDALGLPHWANHIAFAARDLADLEVRRDRWLDHGHDAMEIDHGWCTSIYTNDPNAILVEFCTSTRRLGSADREEALRLLEAASPPVAPPPPTRLFRAAAEAGRGAGSEQRSGSAQARTKGVS